MEGPGTEPLTSATPGEPRRGLTRRQWLALPIWLLLPFAASAIGARFTSGTYYAALAQPGWAPPGWLFGPVWTVLYLLMGLSAWLLWCQEGLGGTRAVRVAWGFFGAQLVLNAAWSWLFFGLRRPDLALVEIAVLWALIGATLVAFWRRRVLAGALLLPYLLWVSFAVALNAALWWLNR